MSHPIVVAVAQAFKGTLPLGVVADAMAAGITEAGAEPRVLRASDGGDGLLDALASCLIRRTRHVTVDPLLRSIDAEIGWLERRTAVIESRLACGTALLAPAERDPLVTSTRGVGLLVAAAREAGAEAAYVGLGGSATMDGGLGMARGFGWNAAGADGQPVPEGGGALRDLTHLAPGRPPGIRLTALADVTSPLLGPEGVRRYAAQKGADARAADRMEAGLGRLVALTAPWGGPAVANREGAGAAGGLGFGFRVFHGAELVRGAPWVLDRVGWTDAVTGAALIVTGEGAFDGTSTAGKLTGEVLARARGLPVVVVAPRATAVPEGVVVEQGGEVWDGRELARRVAAAVRRALRLPPP